jgi:hypothetical protein
MLSEITNLTQHDHGSHRRWFHDEFLIFMTGKISRAKCRVFSFAKQIAFLLQTAKKKPPQNRRGFLIAATFIFPLFFPPLLRDLLDRDGWIKSWCPSRLSL